MPNSSKGRLVCAVCDRSYGRATHFHRHMKTHVSAIKHVCDHCFKEFARADSLHRHRTYCLNQLRPVPAYEPNRASFRACTECAKARQRCSHSAVCARCVQRGLKCVYPSQANCTEAGDDGSATIRSHVSTSCASEIESSSGRNGPPLVEHCSPGLSLTVGSNAVAASPVPSPLPSTTQPTDTSDSVDTESATWPVHGNHHARHCPSAISSMTGTIEQPPDSGRVDETALASPADHGGPPNFGYTPRVQERWHQLSLMARSALGGASDTEIQGSGPRSSLKDMIVGQQHEPLPHQGLLSHHSSPLEAVSVRSELETVFSSDSGSTQHYSAGGGARNTYFRDVPRLGQFSTSRNVRARGQLRLEFPQLSDYTAVPDINNWGTALNAAYGRLCYTFHDLCVDKTHFFVGYTSPSFIPQHIFNSCITKYFDNVHPHLPFILETSFREEPDDTLVLATAAMGAFSLECDQAAALGLACHEFLRRAILSRAEALKHQDVHPSAYIPFVQASLLNVLGLCNLNDDLMQSEAVNTMQSLIGLCREQELFSSEPTKSLQPEDWETWRRQEEIRRTVYCVWLQSEALGRQLERNFDWNLASIQLSLPSSHALFTTSSAESWSLLAKQARPSPTLSDCLNTLEKDLLVPEGLSELGHILIIQGLFSRSHQVREHLYHVSRHRNDGFDHAITSTTGAYLPFQDLLGWPSWVVWRNRMCDCLDVLHRHANGVTGHAGGFEEPVVLHLHAARIVLLAPYVEIQRVAAFLSCRDHGRSKWHLQGAMTEALYAETLTAIRVWLSHDRYKMRLAVIHAGGIFWHIRRYSTQGFFEPTALFLAALVIWSYCLRTRFLSPLPTDPCLEAEGYLATPTIRPDGDKGHGTDDDQSTDKMQVYIDRVLDDELVQTIVLGQEPLEMHMSRVGNLDLALAPGKVLTEAARLLQLRCSAWPISRTYHECLTWLAEPSRQLR